MANKILTMALLAMVSVASPYPTTDAPCLSTDFSLAMLIGVGNNYVSLNAINNGTDGILLLVAGPPSNEPGTPVALNGTSGSATLDVKFGDDSEKEGTYGISVPDLGERYSTAVPVLATEGADWPHFYYGGNEIDPQRTAASQGWYACNDTVQSETHLTLNWGVYNSNGSSPWDCAPTRVIRVFNIPCGYAS